MALLEDPQRVTKPRRAVVTPTSSDKTSHWSGREEYGMDRGKLMPRLLEEAPGQKEADFVSLSEQQGAFVLVPEGLPERGQFLKMEEDAFNKPTYKLEARLVRVTKEMLVEIMKTIGADRN